MADKQYVISDCNSSTGYQTKSNQTNYFIYAPKSWPESWPT